MPEASALLTQGACGHSRQQLGSHRCTDGNASSSSVERDEFSVVA